MSLIEIKNVSKSFKKLGKERHQVLQQIDLTIEKEEFVTFIGPSGCGKSTLLNIIAGLKLPDAGAITVNQEKVVDPGLDRVMVFQEGALFPWMTVLDNVTFGLRSKKIDSRKAHELAVKQLEVVHLHKFQDAYPHQLSGGMKQRVAIARALVMNPEILLMDEPFGALDEQTRNLIQDELIELWLKNKNTIVFVTHNIREAIKLSDRIIVFGIHPGRIVKEFRLDWPHPRNIVQKECLEMEQEISELLRVELSTVNGRAS